MMIVNNNRVIPPSYTVHTNYIRKPFKILHDNRLVRYIWLYIPSIWSYRHKPVLSVVLQHIHAAKHRCRILRTECNKVDKVRRQTISRHLTFVIRIAYKYISFLYSVNKPFRIKCRNISPHSCLYNHIYLRQCIPTCQLSLSAHTLHLY